MTKSERDELRRLAEKAKEFTEECLLLPIFSYVEASKPDRVLLLIDTIDELERKVEDLRNKNLGYRLSLRGIADTGICCCDSVSCARKALEE